MDCTEQVMMLSGPIPATEKLFEKTQMTIDQIDLCVVVLVFTIPVITLLLKHSVSMRHRRLHVCVTGSGLPYSCMSALIRPD